MNVLRSFAFVSLCVLCLANVSFAALVDNGDGTITDTSTNLMWLQDAQYAKTSGYPAYGMVSEYCPSPNPATCFPIVPEIGIGWDDAMTWASTLNHAGYTDWRLPHATNPDGTGPQAGSFYWGLGTGEQGHLAFTEGITVASSGPFTNVRGAMYWTDALLAADHDNVWYNTVMGSGSQAGFYARFRNVMEGVQIPTRLEAWAVRDVSVAMAPADFDLDGDVDGADLAVWESSFGVDAGADADADGDSDGADFLAWQQQFTGPGPLATATTVPEPTGATLLFAAFVCFGMLRDRTRGG